MAKQRYINTKFWSDPYIQELDSTSKLFYLYLLTNEHTSICGIYEISIKTMSFESGLSEDKVRYCIDTLSKGMKAYFLFGKFIILCNFPKYQESEKSPKIKQGILASLSQLPANLLKEMDTLSIPYIYPSNYINTNTNINNIGATKVAQGNLPDKPMDYSHLEDNGITYEDASAPRSPKKYANHKKLYGRIAVYYMGLQNKTGDALRYFKDVKELVALAAKDFPEDSEAEWEKEIKGRIELAGWHYQHNNVKDWGLGKVVENWNKILTEWSLEKRKFQ